MRKKDELDTFDKINAAMAICASFAILYKRGLITKGPSLEEAMRIQSDTLYRFFTEDELVRWSRPVLEPIIKDLKESYNVEEKTT